MKDVSCVDCLSFVKKNVTYVPTVAPDLPVGARLHQFWEKWEALEASPKVVTVLKEGYTLPFQSNQTRSPTIISGYVHPQRNLYLMEPLHALIQKNAVKQITTPGFYNRLSWFTQQLVKTYTRPQYREQIFKDRVIQNGETRDNKDLPTSRGVGHLHSFQRLIPPHTNSKSVQQVHAFSHPGSVLPIQSSHIWSVHSTHGVHGGGKGGQTDCTTKGYEDSPVSRQLVGQSQIPPNLSPAYVNSGSYMSRLGLVGQHGEVLTGFQTSL